MPQLQDMSQTSSSVFQNMLGMTSLDVSVRNTYHRTGDSYPLVDTPLDTMTQAQRFLELGHAVHIGKFLTVLIMQLVTKAQLPFRVTAYADLMHRDLTRLLDTYGDAMGRRGVAYADLRSVVNKFEKAAENFHFGYNPSPALDMLAHHEFNDQMLELERQVHITPIKFFCCNPLSQYDLTLFW